MGHEKVVGGGFNKLCGIGGGIGGGEVTNNEGLSLTMLKLQQNIEGYIHDSCFRNSKIISREQVSQNARISSACAVVTLNPR